MQSSRQPWSQLPQATLFLTVFGLSLLVPLAQPAPAQKKLPPLAVSQENKDKDIEAVQSELFDLLRLSPKLTMAISADPTLLGDEAYVSRNNPQLIEFLHNHSEVARNPEFYLFFPTPFSKGGRQRFKATVWPEIPGSEPTNNGWDARDITLFLVFVLILGGLLWILRLVLEHNKWNKVHRMQSELFSKLLDKSSTNEELVSSFRNAGKPFFDLATIEPRTSNPLTRVFLPLQFGIVLAFVGGTLLFLRNSAPTEGDTHKLVAIGAIGFTLGVGFIVSAAVSYLLARHLGLLPQPAKPNETHARD